MKNDDKKRLKEILVTEKAALEKSLVQIQDSTQAVTLDQQSVGRVSRIDAIQQQQMALATQRKDQQRLALIEKTLTRMETEDYGYCQKCDEPIAMKRLELDPTTPFCIACAR